IETPLAPQPVRAWANNPPQWLQMRSPSSILILSQLDPGEMEAIALATEVNADLVLIDEQAGRKEALRKGLKVAGTLAVLDEADREKLIVFDDAIADLRKTSFRISQTVLSEIKQKRSR